MSDLVLVEPVARRTARDAEKRGWTTLAARFERHDDAVLLELRDGRAWLCRRRAPGIGGSRGPGGFGDMARQRAFGTEGRFGERRARITCVDLQQTLCMPMGLPRRSPPLHRLAMERRSAWLLAVWLGLAGC